MDKRKGRGKKPRQAVPAYTARHFRKLAMHDRETAASVLRDHPEFLEEKDGVGESALHYCAVEGKLDAVAWLVGLGADVNTRTKFGEAPLLNAAKLGYETVCQFLTESGADVNAVDESGDTALHHAASYGYSEICAQLVAAGADPNFRNDMGETAADLALPRKRDKVLAALGQIV